MAVRLIDIAKEAGVSQMTVSRVLNRKAEGQVSKNAERKVRAAVAKLNYQCISTESKMISTAPAFLPAPPRRVITVLLPHPTYLEHSGTWAADDTVVMLNAILQVASEKNAKVETIPISRNNSPVDIEWDWLESLNRDSLIFATGNWFHPVLMELARRGARIAVIQGEALWRKAYQPAQKNWARFTMLTTDAAVQLTHHFSGQGLSRIAIASPFIREPEDPLVAGYLHEMTEADIPYRNAIRLYGQDVSPIAEAFRNNPFDALIYDNTCHIFESDDYRTTPNKLLGIPESVKVAFRFSGPPCLMFHPNVTAVEFPRKEMGTDAANILLAEAFEPCEKFYKGRLIERESTEQKKILKGRGGK